MPKNRRRSRRTYVKNHVEEIDMLDDDFCDCMSAFRADVNIQERREYTIEYYRQELTKFMHTREDRRIKTRLRAITADIIKDEYIYIRREQDGVKTASI